MFGLSYLAPLIASALISATVGSYAFARRRTKGAPAFAVAAFSQASWTFGYVFELGSETLEAKILWDDFQFVGAMGWVLGFFAFAHTYTGIPFARWRGIWLSHCLFASGYLALVFTDRWHALIRPRAQLVPGHPFDALVYPFTPATLIISLYLFIAFGAALFQLVRQLRGVANIYRKQLAFVLAGALIPMLGTLLTLFEVLPFVHRDTTPLTFAVGNLLMAWGLFRHRLLDLVPFARDTLLEHLQDPVIVLDLRLRVLDLNPAARSLVSDSAELRLGTPCAELFSRLPELVAALSAEPAHAVEVSVKLRGERRTFAVSVKELREAEGVVGRVAIAHDVSELERVQRELVERNRELEGANRELDAFAHSVSHDLRAPLRNLLFGAP